MKKDNDILSGFDGKILHPSLDIKDNILILGFRYRTKEREEKELFLFSKEGTIECLNDTSFKYKEQSYFIEKGKRKLIRIEERWGLDDLKKFLEEYSSLNPDPPLKELFEKIKGLAKKYIELERDSDYALLCAWVIGTYFYPTFYAYPFLNIKAPKRSGKSQCLNFLTQLCFNPVKARPSLAALGDTVDSLRGTYLIDQADSLERKGGEELLDILADSYKRSGGKRRIINFDKGKNREISEYETYSPKVFASIKELPEDLRDRCLIVPLIRSQKNFLDPDDENENWKEIRGMLYRFLLINHAFVSSTYSVKKIEHKHSQDILGRTLELWLPFEVILECVGAKDELPEAKKRFLSGYGFAEYEPSDIEENVVSTILNRLQDIADIILSPKEISKMMNSEIFIDAATPKQKAAKVGWAIKKFNLASEKKPRTKDGVCYLFEKQKIENIYHSYFKKAEEPTLPT